MHAKQVLDLWHTPEPAWKFSQDLEHGDASAKNRFAAGFHLAKRNVDGSINTEDIEHAVPLLDDELEKTISTR